MNEKGKLGLGSGVAICVGLIVATSCLLSLGVGMGLAGKAFIIPLIVVVILNAFIALSFSELHTLMPNVDGGVGQYSLVGLGPVASMISNISAYVITMVFASSVEIAMCGLVLNEFFPQIPAVAISVIVLVVIGIVNLFGVDLFSKVQNLVVILLIGSLIGMGIISFFKLGTGTVITAAQQTAPAITGIGGLMGLSAIAFWLFIGVEFIIPVAKDLKNPKRDVLLSMILALILLFVVQAVLGVGMTNYVSLDVLASSAMPHMVFAEAVLGDFGKAWMGIVTLLAGISTLNTVLASSARIICGMSEEGMMPSIFKKINKKNVPVFGLALMMLADFGIVVTGFAQSNALTNLILAASCFWLMSYILTHINVLVLRKRYPNMERNKKLVLMGIPQIIGILGNIYMIWNISSDPASRLAIYQVCGVLFAILVTYALIWVIGVMKVKPFEPVDIDKVNNDAIEFEKGNKKRLVEATE
ncbi:APC family permease [Acetobacterium woodii]|uniref:Amino acid/polyamine transporter I n=1 Tax=Acetobacterium woodii (strain ATCC 29683 / DSM 1030 / JCM 2381 / KCTC 1655 / WB1) TaxID=931626 RepID=H6LKC0_ACEWD|nr:APC family permease [Acetobacterium woodii]AFA47510.1 amino acid/polyamine transporter I [Acetobacterium woodii DSM 1030]